MEFQQNSATTAVFGNAATINTPKISSPLYRRNMTPDKRSPGSVCCRICHEDGTVEELIDPCECSGTLGLIHTCCLEKWLSMSNTDRCEICKHLFSIQKKNKSLTQSFKQWWRTRNIYGPQGVTGDIVCLIVLTPLCIAATYLCSVGASAYSRLGFWEGTGLAILCCMLVTTYCLWLIVTLRFHFKSWQQWRRRNQDVKLIVKHKVRGFSNFQII
ncbi:E3 ubiquitin-protein ligase MARCH3-like [Apis florea]|uniref:E3 ubiquitin-protein ligase MARCH3-like n=1 Tax=Apis florea TaxID=7463 RepID=UPI000252C6F9|nr:E3 ubiquitin-protein ligase MARCH3-like [Apis florea]